MRKAIWSAVFLVMILFVGSVQACEDCFEDYDGYHWCEYCDYSPCGYFHCYMKQYAQLPNMEYCTGDDSGCFELGHGCQQQPEMRFEPLAARWQLASVQIRTAGPARTRTARAPRRTS